MDKNYFMVCEILNEFGNCAAGITGAYESPARPWKVNGKPEKSTAPVMKKYSTPLVKKGKPDKKKGY